MMRLTSDRDCSQYRAFRASSGRGRTAGERPRRHAVDRAAVRTDDGSGNVTLPSTGGRPISVVIMIFGVAVLFNLARASIVPSKARFRCPTCGLRRYDVDAVHCEACGTVLNIPDEGLS